MTLWVQVLKVSGMAKPLGYEPPKILCWEIFLRDWYDLVSHCIISYLRRADISIISNIAMHTLRVLEIVNIRFIPPSIERCQGGEVLFQQTFKSISVC